jgi:predicted RNA binding protein YcfA (HicA-like mRNA interferase family)
MTVRELMKLLLKDGWFVDHTTGSHIQMEHRKKKGTVTVPNHKGDIASGTLAKIKRQAGWK